MHEIDQKILQMTLAEFRAYVVPDGWRLQGVSGEESFVGGDKWDFNLRVVIEKRKHEVL